MRTRILILIGTVALTAPACAGRLLTGTVSLSPGETTWIGGQAPAGSGQGIQTRPGAKSADASRSLQNRGRGVQRARPRQVRSSGLPSITGAPTAPEPTGTVGSSGTVAPPSATTAGAPAAATPAARRTVTIEAGLVRRFRSTPKLLAVVASTVVIVIAVFAFQRYRRPGSTKGSLRPFVGR
jgi:hypothetical protein